MKFSSLDFVKANNESYFELLRLSRISVNDDDIDLAATTALLNQLPFFHKEHKRVIPLLYNKA